MNPKLDRKMVSSGHPEPHNKTAREDGQQPMARGTKVTDAQGDYSGLPRRSWSNHEDC